MKYALKALGWAIIILWICLISLIATTVYSAFNIKVEVGDSESYVKDQSIVWAQSFIIDNTGFYDISDLNMTTTITDDNGTVLIKKSSFTDEAPKNKRSIIWHNISIRLDEITRYHFYLTNDAVFIVKQVISLVFARIIPFKLSFNSSMNWGAPLYGLEISEIEIQPFNSTYSRILVDIGFENNSPFNLDGAVNVEVFNQYGVKIGWGQEELNAPSGALYEEIMEVLVDTSEMTSHGTVRVSFETSFFSYEMEVQYGG